MVSGLATVFELLEAVHMVQLLKIEFTIAVTSTDNTIHKHGSGVQHHEHLDVHSEWLSIKKITNGCFKSKTINTTTVPLSIQVLIMSIEDVHPLKKRPSSRYLKPVSRQNKS